MKELGDVRTQFVLLRAVAAILKQNSTRTLFEAQTKSRGTICFDAGRKPESAKETPEERTVRSNNKRPNAMHNVSVKHQDAMCVGDERCLQC